MNENKEYITHPEEKGNILISEDVLCAIAASAALEIDGVAGLMNASGKKNAGKGVKIVIEDDRAVVNVYLMVAYGEPIPEVAEKVQKADSVATAVQSAIENLPTKDEIVEQVKEQLPTKEEIVEGAKEQLKGAALDFLKGLGNKQ